MSMRNRDERLEELTNAWRPDKVYGGPRTHPVWYDLDDEDREEAFRRCAVQRTLEAALDADGLSSTGRAVLAKINKTDRMV
ncbi:MAG: hypothetical protein ACI835_002516 [Planctomycetota bacterium]|jgi:hypothetical protein